MLMIFIARLISDIDGQATQITHSLKTHSITHSNNHIFTCNWIS